MPTVVISIGISSSKGDKMAKKKLYYCQYCDKKVTGSAFKFRAHLFRHGQIEARFVCQHCPKRFYRSDQYNLHATTHSKADRTLFICDTCGRRFLKKMHLIKHMSYHRSDRHKCSVCELAYCEYRLLVNHIRRTHFNLEGRQTSHAGKFLNETWVERVLRSDVFVVMTKLTPNAITIRKYTRAKSELPKVKDFGPANEARLKAKELPEPNDPFFDDRTGYYSRAICNYCNKAMLKKSLAAHIRERHLKVKKFRCESCGGNFSRRYQMIKHDCERHKRKAKSRGQR